MKKILFILIVFCFTLSVSAQRASTNKIVVGNDTTQVLSTGTVTLDWNSGSNGIITALSANSTVNVHNVPDGKSGTVHVTRDATTTETFAINVYSDAGSTLLTKKVIGTNSGIGAIASETSTVTYKRFSTNTIVIYGHEN